MSDFISLEMIDASGSIGYPFEAYVYRLTKQDLRSLGGVQQNLRVY